MIPGLVEKVWRADAATMLGALSRRLGDLDRAEEALQEAVTEALQRWPDEGVPDNPAGWLVTTGWRKALDRIRREAIGRDKLARVAADAPALTADAAGSGAAVGAQAPVPGADDRLAMIFACCHPSLAESSRIALTLYAASGLTTEEIAAAFLVPVPTMAQRLVRAKRQLREGGVRFEVPRPDEYADRLPAVLSVIYLVFNEGYLASGRQRAQRRELAREGMELARQVAGLLPGEPEAAGLAALLEFHEARAATRFDSWGRIVLLEHQDRRRWDRAKLAAATDRLRRAVARGVPGPYQVQAGIAAQHALAASYASTDWAAIRDLYDRLYALAPSPVVLLNRAVATRFVAGPGAALAEVEALADRFAGYRLWHAVRAELLTALGRTDEARHAAERAHALATNPAERELMSRRVAALARDDPAFDPPVSAP
jgi:RNA polymerase sigma-70 factor, ECF subfamily